MKKRLSTLAALAVGVTWLFTPGTAARAAQDTHCWTNIDTGASKCFSTFAAVVADLSGGRMKVSGGAAAFSQADATALDAVVLAATPSAVVYEDAGFGGASNTYLASSVCDTSTDVDFQVSLVGTAWNDRITSFKSFNNCETKIWTGVLTGSSSAWSASNSGVGAALNDQASSIQWR